MSVETAEEPPSSPSAAWTATLGAAFERDARYLWGLSYRLTGSASLAEDLVQETFVRALRRPPADVGRPLRPWLRRVATNLGIDALRRRQSRPYDGPWLPEPIDTAGLSDPAADVEDASLRREGLTLAFVVLLELLSPQQRAVVVLRDGLGLSVAETAEALDVARGNVKVAHHRARQRLAEASAQAPDADQRRRHGERLGELFGAIASGDEAQVIELLSADVRALSDGGGVVRAARRVVVGARDVARLLVGIARKGAPPVGVTLREINCLPAFDATYGPADPRGATRAIFQGVLGADGRFTALHIILAPAKTAAVERTPWLRPSPRPAELRVVGGDTL